MVNCFHCILTRSRTVLTTKTKVQGGELLYSLRKGVGGLPSAVFKWRVCGSPLLVMSSDTVKEGKS